MADNRQYSSGANATANVNSNANLTREISDMSSCLVLDGLPIVPNQAGASKLREVLLRILNEKKCSPKSLDIVVGDTGASLGFAFLEYSNRKAADDALIALNNLPIDKVHRLRTNAWIDFDTYLSNSALRNRQSEFSAAHETKLATFKNPYAWLNDANAREQYLIKSGNTYDVEIFWSDPHMLAKREPILGPNEGAIATAPQEWTECDRARGRVQREYPCWSPLGTYIVSVNTKGIRTWVDSDSSGSWKCFLRFDHSAVLKFDFSPCEKYLVTGCRKQCILWDVRLGKFITSFPIGADDKSWPIFRWKFDDSMFTQVLPTMLLMFNAKNLSTWTIPYPAKPEVTFSWSPASHHIAYSTISKERCLKVVLEEVLSATDRRDLAVRTIHNVDAVRIVWCPNGKFCLCVINIRGMRPDKVEVFSILNGKEASVDQIDIEGIVLDVSWDSSGLYGNRFCVLNTVKKTEEAFNAVTFYEIDGEELRTLHTLPKRQALQASWSPCGTHLVLIESSGSLEFVTISPEGKVQSLQIVEQPRYHSSFWDPSGRYFITSSTMQLTSELDLGFVMFNFLGQRICTHAQISKFSHFLWRPRPASPLSQDDITDLLGTLDKRVQAYEREDEERRANDAEVARVHNEEVRQRYYTTIQAVRESFKAKTKDREKRVARLYTQTPMFHLVKKVREEIVSYV